MSSIDNSPDNMDSAITVIHGKTGYKHPSEEGTSVDDEMVSEEEQSNRSGGLTVMPSVQFRYFNFIYAAPKFISINLDMATKSCNFPAH